MKNKRLVTGGAGFISSNLAEELAGKNEVVIIEALGEAGKIAVFVYRKCEELVSGTE
ncbi:MAG: hypothetical protein L6244_03190 [Candidatus Methanoperedenaceae archaeon]|nr:hypothetical protein [Euryarchaeota archaeon]MCG2727639.1 hypothetical protein [Candidatus Methanoperedenaceae archaeon]